MSKQFVTFDKFDKLANRLESLKQDWQDSNEWHANRINDVEEELDKFKEVINANADNGEALETQVNELTKRLDKMNRAMQVIRTDVNAKNTDGMAMAVCVGALSLFGFICVGFKISELANQIDLIEAKQKMDREQASMQKPNPEFTFRSQSDTEDPNITFTGTKED